MFYPKKDEYLKYAENDYDIVPVFKEILADMDTPVSVLQCFADSQNAFLLESIEGGENWGRFSFVGIDPELLLETDHSEGKNGELEALRNIYKDLKVAELSDLPRFFGGAVGFTGYESIGEFEDMPLPKADSQHVKPRSCFLKADKLIVFDNVRHTIKIVFCTRPKDAESFDAAYDDAIKQIDKIAESLHTESSLSVEKYDEVEFNSNMSRAEYIDMVRKAKEYIVEGDIIQVVLSQRFSAQTKVPPVQLYRALRLLNPSPYTFFLKLGEKTLVGSSPEVMVRLTGSRVEVRPIAGTRPRGDTEQEDRKLADDLLSDEKEKAEHVMLVDLGRNDIGRIAEPGSVQVSEYMVIERYSHVMHLVSHVEGVLRKEFDAYDVLKATFPAGTLSGAPKIRAMEIIRELEPTPRGAYGGALGYISYTGNMDLAITIRTLEVEDNVVSVQAGAGIVYDSDPDSEYDETCHKARGMQKAVEMAARGLELK